MLRGIIHLLIVFVLTVLTQIGGVVYLIAILAIKRTTNKRRLKRLGLFSVLYLAATYLIVPLLAPIFGREKIKETELIQSKFFFYTLANRNYVKPALNIALQNISEELHKKHNGIQLIYLDANFPFFDGFPLFPHLSHSDGKKIDITFIYATSQGKITNKKPSISGYGAYEKPRPSEYDQISVCKEKGYWQYDFSQYVTLGIVHKDLLFSVNGSRILVRSIVKQNTIGKLFIEPHLKKRLNIPSSKIRYHGCQAVRHDDHIHFQLK